MQTIRCNNCGQMLGEKQNICPSCKQPVVNPVVENSQNDPCSINEGLSYIAPSSLPMRICVIVCVILILAFRFIVAGIIQPIIQQNADHINTNHIETPVGVEDDDAMSFSYSITQLFFKCDEADNNKTQIEQFLKDTGIEYDNLCYTDTGYYTADVFNCSNLTKQQNKEKSDEILQAFESFQWTFSIRIDIQSFYKKLA